MCIEVFTYRNLRATNFYRLGNARYGNNEYSGAFRLRWSEFDSYSWA